MLDWKCLDQENGIPYNMLRKQNVETTEENVHVFEVIFNNKFIIRLKTLLCFVYIHFFVAKSKHEHYQKYILLLLFHCTMVQVKNEGDT